MVKEDSGAEKAWEAAAEVSVSKRGSRRSLYLLDALHVWIIFCWSACIDGTVE